MAQTKHEPYLDRELSWLEFNSRVLDQARGQEHPLLERVKFLAITASNLDEFFQVRVGSLQFLLEEWRIRGDAAVATVEQRLAELKAQVRQFTQQQYAVLLEELEPQLAEQDIRRLPVESLNESQWAYLERQFNEVITSVISPLHLEPQSPFPLLAGAPLCLCVSLRGGGTRIADAAEETPKGTAGGQPEVPARHVVISLGKSLNRLWTLPEETGFHYVLLESVVKQFVPTLFPGEEVMECTTFRVTRNADLEVDEVGGGNLLEEIEQLLEGRKVSDCIRVEVDHSASPAMQEFLREALHVEPADIYPCRGPIDLSALMRLTQIQGRGELKDEPWPPQLVPDMPAGSDLFEIIAERDRLLFHPYQTYDPVVELLQRAAADPDVLAIKQTLYRTSRNSAIVAALADAARTGKHVTAIVELKARFDEARNIAWARQLETAGVDVIYGIRGLKVHAKLCIVVRRESGGIRRYIHVGTGNYNEVTSKLYSDLSYLTCDRQLGDDAIRAFNAIAGFSAPLPLQKIVLAPLSLRERLTEMIEIETLAAKSGAEAQIDMKLNSLVDTQIIDALYAASQAGVQINLNVRGICCLRPGVAGLSENIRVVSVVDRFLEHSRIFRFCHNGDNLMMIGSADLMPRNLDRRVEILVPVEDPECKADLQMILDCFLGEHALCYQLQPDGTYRRSRPKKGVRYRCQERLYRIYTARYEKFVNPQTKIFRPIRGE